MQRPLKLTCDVVKSMGCGAVLRDEEGIMTLNSLDYHSSGELFATASDNASISLYDALNAKLLTKIHSKRTGTKMVRYTHSKDAVLYVGSTVDSKIKDKTDNCIHYLSLPTNQFLRHFSGHQGSIKSISKIHALKDSFLSSDETGLMCRWDLRVPRAVAQLKRNDEDEKTGDVVIANDPPGMVFAVGVAGWIKIYDSNNAEKGPFIQQDLNELLLKHCGAGGRIESICISSNDNEEGDVIVSTNTETMIALNPRTLEVTYVLKDRKKRASRPLPISISPDGEFLVSASERTLPAAAGQASGKAYEMLVWNLAGKTPTKPPQVITSWVGTSLIPVRAMEWNPRYASFASACCAVKLFVPQPTR